jgi:hypothetical protein
MKLEMTQKNIARLQEENAAFCITIYMPLSKTTREKDSDKVRFENLLKDAARQIIAGGRTKSDARQIVEPGFKLAQDHFFWKTDAAGLAFFISPSGILNYFELHPTVKESVYVGQEFDLSRLMKSFNNCLEFFILALSKNNLSFYKASCDKLEKTVIRNLPENLKSLSPDKTFEKQLQVHGRSPHGKQELIHGQGRGKETEKVLLRRYFQTISTALRPVLVNKKLPLVFAGASNLFPIFRQSIAYSGPLINLKGNFDEVPPERIREKALELLKNAA